MSGLNQPWLMHGTHPNSANSERYYAKVLCQVQYSAQHGIHGCFQNLHGIFNNWSSRALFYVSIKRSQIWEENNVWHLFLCVRNHAVYTPLFQTSDISVTS